MYELYEMRIKSLISRAHTKEELLDIRDNHLVIDLNSDVGALEQRIYDKLSKLRGNKASKVNPTKQHNNSNIRSVLGL